MFSVVSEPTGIEEMQRQMTQLSLVLHSRALVLAESRIKYFFAGRLTPVVSMGRQSVQTHLKVSNGAQPVRARQDTRTLSSFSGQRPHEALDTNKR